MRPRTIFAGLLACGAAVHLGLLKTPPASLLPIAVYSGWLLLSGAVATTLFFKVRRANATVVERRLLRGRKVPPVRLDGIAPFALAAGAGLVMHFLNAISTSGPRIQQRGMWLVFFILLAGSLVQLRGPRGDVSAPVRDGSPVARVGSLLRRLVGVTLGLVGVGLLYLGIAQAVPSGDGFAITISWFFKASGLLLVLIGLALALLPSRDDA